MKNIIPGIKINGYKWISFMAALAFMGCFNQAFAVTYGELNQQRAQMGLPLLTGNDQFDFQMLAIECNRGIGYSCFLARQLQGSLQQQQRAPTPIPYDLNNPLEGLPDLGPADPRSINNYPNRGSSGSNPSSSEYECRKCQRNVQDCWDRQKRMNSPISGGSMARTCSSWESTCDRICNQ